MKRERFMENEVVKVFHIESGLGNQMLDYVELLAVKKTNPKARCYMETIISEIPEAGKTISQWNGFELQEIFKNIKDANVRSLFSDQEWECILRDVVESKFWTKHWDYPQPIVNALAKQGLILKNKCHSLDMYRREDADYVLSKREKIRLGITKFFRTPCGNFVKRKLKKMTKNNALEVVKKQREELFAVCDNNEYLGHNLTFQCRVSGIEKLDREIKYAFQFPELRDKKNMEMMQYLRKVNSVAIHARRGDMLTVGSGSEYYKFGYFKRAVRYIKKNVENPEFIFFCDSGSAEWCKNNMKIFALDPIKDRVYFVDWNRGKDSYIDMQLMSYCKHNIITNSSFGWWGAYLNSNPKKITISPEWTINTTVTV